MKTLFLLLALSFTGCASYNSTQVRVISTNSVETVTTKVRIQTLFDAKSELAKLKLTTTEKTQSLGIGGLNQESTSTNLVNLFEAVARGAAAGAGKTLVPIP